MITLEEFERLSAEYNVVPVMKRLFAGVDTPVGLYQKLCGDRPDTFLLESAEQGVWGRFSFIGISCRGSLSASEEAVWSSKFSAVPNGALSQNPIDALKDLQAAWHCSPTDYPLTSGLVGFISWGLTEHLENLPARKEQDYSIPLYTFLQFSELVIVDHQRSELVLVSVAFIDGTKQPDALYQEAIANLADLERRLLEPTEPLISEISDGLVDYQSNTSREDFLASVESAKDYIRIGDVFQVVISQRFKQEFNGDPLDVYRALRASNPSPYMYLVRLQDDSGMLSIVGSSPEALVKVNGQRVITHPIAGSRPRSDSAVRDEQLAQELQADEKEKSEHLMLVDLARNDLLRICTPESLQVSEFMQIHRFSHVMHLVSTVEGDLRPGTTAVDALLATFPAGTLSGAPKPRALEIIAELESSYRGLFGGVVGYFDYAGNADLAIAIRTALIRDGFSYMQAGAGIVLDSIPESEYQETLSKAAVVLKSVSIAKAMND